MLQFIEKYQEKATCVLNGFDRIVFRGLLRGLMHPEGMKRHLSCHDVPRRLFGAHAEKTTELLKKASLQEAERLGRPIIYLASSHTRKEAVARSVLQERPTDSGLICVLSCVEPCMTYDMYRNRDLQKLELVYRLRKCLHLYHYYLDPVFGFMNARIQTWYPFPVQICMNGREWLAHRMDEKGLRYVRHENSFVELEDPVAAQQIMDGFLHLDWPAELAKIATQLNPAHKQLVGPHEYYWTTHQTEWATDILFNSPEHLQRIYPQLVWSAIATFSSRDVMRFLGKYLQARFAGEVVSHYDQRPEGLRIKHTVNTNSIKMYDKGGRILRVETTINNAGQLTVYRPKEGGRPDDIRPRQLRRGIADLPRRAQICQRTNDRYLNALSAISTDVTLADLLNPVTKPVRRCGKHYRPLRPWEHGDLHLLQIINRPEHLLGGFRNKDLSTLLFPTPPDDPRARRAASGRTAYRLRLLFAHRLIKKTAHSRRYQLTAKGRQICTMILLAQHATIQQLERTAA